MTEEELERITQLLVHSPAWYADEAAKLVAEVRRLQSELERLREHEHRRAGRVPDGSSEI